MASRPISPADLRRIVRAYLTGSATMAEVYALSGVGPKRGAIICRAAAAWVFAKSGLSINDIPATIVEEPNKCDSLN